jgi:type II secretory pathway pseudopilin PulG
VVRLNFYQKGFTLAEFIVALFVMILVVGGAVAIYLNSLTAWEEGNLQVALQREASSAMEQMVRGPGLGSGELFGTDGIREAQQISSPAIGSTATQINFVDADNLAVTRSFYFSAGADSDATTPADNQLRYIDGSGNDSPIIESGVRALTFNRLSDKVVKIDLGMEGRVIDRKVNVDLSTQVRLRN